jgi:hypothetical protein
MRSTRPSTTRSSHGWNATGRSTRSSTPRGSEPRQLLAGPSYKLGERIWLQAREEAKARAGDVFSLKGFHSKALSLGPMGLDPLREALARI